MCEERILQYSFVLQGNVHIFATETNKERKTVMARPIKETPILFGNDARRFEERMKEQRTVPKEEIERVREHYRVAMSIFKKKKE